MAVMLALCSAGYEVLVPFGENTRYDLVIDDGQSLKRIQCKTGRLRAGAVRFKTCSTYGHHRNPLAAQRSYLGEIDAFAVYCPETSGIYLVPIEDLPVLARAALRVDPARNRQKKFIRLAAKYEVAWIEVRRSSTRRVNVAPRSQAPGPPPTVTSTR
jgi:PD-(D/E)XK endonuclease